MRSLSLRYCRGRARPDPGSWLSQTAAPRASGRNREQSCARLAPGAVSHQLAGHYDGRRIHGSAGTAAGRQTGAMLANAGSEQAHAAALQTARALSSIPFPHVYAEDCRASEQDRNTPRAEDDRPSAVA
jgi:hypothetical protein